VNFFCHRSTERGHQPIGEGAGTTFALSTVVGRDPSSCRNEDRLQRDQPRAVLGSGLQAFQTEASLSLMMRGVSTVSIPMVRSASNIFSDDVTGCPRWAAKGL
jgi:hypothetical protein